MGKNDTIEVVVTQEENMEEDLSKKSNSTRKKKKRRKKHYFLKFLLLCAMVALAVNFLYSDYFNIKIVEVTGNNNYSEEEIIKMSGIKKDVNLFKIKKNKIVDELKKDSYVESVKVVRKVPSTLMLTIKERKEIAAIPYGEEFIIIDIAGFVLNRVEAEPKITILEGLTIEDMKKGQVIKVKEEVVLKETLEMISTMEYSDLFFKKIDMSTVVISAYIYDNLICKGTPNNILTNMKNGNLEAILYDLYKKDIKEGIIQVGADQYCAFSPNIE